MKSSIELYKILPKILNKKRLFVFKNASKSLASKVFDLSVLESRKSKKLENNDCGLKELLKKFRAKDLVLLKTLRKGPDAFVIRVFQLFAYLKGERAERWSDIQESIKPASFKLDLWKLSHRRIEPIRLQWLNKLLTNAEVSEDKTNELYFLASALLEWIKWVLHKESVGKKIIHCIPSRSTLTTEEKTINGRRYLPIPKKHNRNITKSTLQEYRTSNIQYFVTTDETDKRQNAVKKLLRLNKKEIGLPMMYRSFHTNPRVYSVNENDANTLLKCKKIFNQTRTK